MHNRNQELDFLRAYAIIGVFVAHVIPKAYWIARGQTWSGSDIAAWDGGVDLFFVLSGYVVSDSFQRLRDKGFARLDLTREFLSRRLIRLWPASTFWLCLLMTGSILFWLVPTLAEVNDQFFLPPAEMFKRLLAGVAYLYNFEEFNHQTGAGYFWSLSLEWQFYLFLPALFMLKARWRTIGIVAAVVVLAFCRFGGSGWWMFRVDGMLLGIALYDLKSKGYLAQLVPRSLSSTACALTTAVLLIEIVYVDRYVTYAYLGISLRCVFSTILVALAVQHKGFVFPFGPARALNWLGLRSYSFYLCHIPVSWIVFAAFNTLGMSANYVLTTATIFALSCVASEMSYRWLERIDANRRAPVKAASLKSVN
jgi:peptidoglycan/LPS O-acetylase OafA/YrhL